MPIKIVPRKKGRSFRNTRRENRLEELGRVDAEKAYTSKGKRNLRAEKKRIVRELKAGGKVKNKKKKPIREVDFGATLEAATEKNRNPMKDQRLDDSFKGKTVRFKKAAGGRAKYNIGGRANLLEEMGRIDARRHPDRADRAEKRRVIRELNKGYNSGGVVLKGKKVGCQIK
jgi:soluble P-type ATPase